MVEAMENQAHNAIGGMMFNMLRTATHNIQSPAKLTPGSTVHTETPRSVLKHVWDFITRIFCKLSSPLSVHLLVLIMQFSALARRSGILWKGISQDFETSLLHLVIQGLCLTLGFYGFSQLLEQKHTDGIESVYEKFLTLEVKITIEIPKQMELFDIACLWKNAYNAQPSDIDLERPKEILLELQSKLDFLEEERRRVIADEEFCAKRDDGSFSSDENCEDDDGNNEVEDNENEAGEEKDEKEAQRNETMEEKQQTASGTAKVV